MGTHNVAASAYTADLDARSSETWYSSRTQKLPLLAPNNMVSGIVLEVGDIVRCPVEVVYDDF